MQTDCIKNIALAGAGNISWHLAKALYTNGFRITGIWSRGYTNAVSLASSCDATPIPDISSLSDGADLIIIAVPDNAIAEVAGRIGHFDGIIVHTAGSVNMDVFAGSFSKYGVFYPLQTFSKENALEMAEVPIFLEASDSETMQALNEVSIKLSQKIYETDSNQRLKLHVAAVFAGNYSNLLYTISNKILGDMHLPQEVLHPLISATASKALKNDPLLMQTGPARRNDIKTLEKHMAVLASYPEYAELYRLMAHLIRENYL